MDGDIGVLGAGSWGTALAVHVAASGHRALLWARRPELAAELAERRENAAYLAGVRLPPGVHPTADLAAVAACRRIVAVVPSHGFREVLRRCLAEAPPGQPTTVISATKGIEVDGLARMSEVTAQEAARAGRNVGYAVLSGPTFAAEMAAGSPTAAVIASADPDLAAELQEAFSRRHLRLYRSHDVVGVELGGAAKNVIAIAAGVVAGLELGHNTLAALITRGLHEIARLGLACGGEPQTFSGLAGLGDLVLTCTGGLSRNRRTGLALAAGKSLAEISAATPMVAEGIINSSALARLARSLAIEMPITEQMVAVLYEGKPAARAVGELMARTLKEEGEL